MLKAAAQWAASIIDGDMSSFKAFLAQKQAGGVQVGVRHWSGKADADARQRVCSTSQPCRCAPSTKRHRVGADALVSVIAPTTGARAELHAALYASFARQRHAKKELLVLDTGAARPSPFFAALDDARVRYVHEPDLVTGDDGDAEKVGIKRNRLCAMARGDAMACFDDDNVYGPDYLTVMLQHLAASGSQLLTLGAYYTAEIAGDGFNGGWLNSNRGAASDRYLEIRGVVVGRARKCWDKRGETFFFSKDAFDRGRARFTESKSCGEEEAFYRGDDFHAVVDDAGIFVHVDHGKNTGAPLSNDYNRRDLPAELAALLREQLPCYRRFAAAVANGTACADIAYEPNVDGWVQKPARRAGA